MYQYHQSEALFARAKDKIPGGVNSPVRAFLSVGGTPPFIREADGCTMTDADGNRYIDSVAAPKLSPRAEFWRSHRSGSRDGGNRVPYGAVS